MTKKHLLPLALVGVSAMGVFAASGIGSATSERSELPGDRETVTMDVKRGPATPASAASAVASGKKGKVKIQHFILAEDLEVPVLPGASDIVRVACRGKARVISGDYQTSNGIFADQFAAVSKKAFEFGFVNITGSTGTASPGIFCAKGVK
jgi:hypothetical protein